MKKQQADKTEQKIIATVNFHCKKKFIYERTNGADYFITCCSFPSTVYK